MIANQLKKEIATAKARVVTLESFVRQNVHFASQAFAAGHFSKAADQFLEFAQMALEVSKLNTEIQQLSFDLEKVLDTPELNFSVPVPAGSGSENKPASV